MSDNIRPRQKRFSKRTLKERLRVNENKILRMVERGSQRVEAAGSLGAALSRKGRRVEEDFFDAWNGKGHDTWLFRIRKATRQQDQDGIDAIAETSEGEIFIQIKSGKFKHRYSRYESRGIVVIKIDQSDNYATIRQKTIDKLRPIIMRANPDI